MGSRHQAEQAHAPTWVTEEHRGPTRHGLRVLHASCLQLLHQRAHVLDAEAEVAVAATVLGPAAQGVLRWQMRWFSLGPVHYTVVTQMRVFVAAGVVAGAPDWVKCAS